MSTSKEEISPEVLELSTYIARAVQTPLPEEVVERAKIHIVDTFAAMIAGSQLLPGQRAIAFIASQGGVEEAAVFGSRLVTSAANAAFANGMLAHADESDDVHPSSGTHPGSGVVPAAFAIGERNGLPGSEVLRAVVLGYDVCARLINALGFQAIRRVGLGLGGHSRSFGAAAAASGLLGLDAHQVREVLSYTAEAASGLVTNLRDTEHVQKAFVSGRGAQNGVLAGLMVASGFSGVEDSFSGPFNYFTLYSPSAEVTELVKELGSQFEIMRTAIKPWTSGGPTQAPLSALRNLIREHNITADQVEKVVVRLPAPDAAVVDNREMPNICAQHLIATMLIDGTLSYNSSHDYARMQDPEVLALRQRVELVGDPGMVEAVRRWRAEMDIELKDGRTVSEEMLAVKGTLANPMDREEETEKAVGLIAPVLGEARALALIEALWELDAVNDVRALREFVSL